ncbi:hypothetical protein F5883DRAFT_635310 [Diaporthe sp. PMI_573]|nr:hypothetical protein F5883DRAFT_635310 [Diaporthaceae sp. PMI_573]
MVAEMIVLPIRTREFRPAHEYTIMFKVAEGDYYHMPAAQVQQICPELETTVDEAIKDGTAMTDVFEVPTFLEQQWKDWWTINDYVEQGKSHAYQHKPTHPACWKGQPGCELTTYEPISSFLTDARVYILAKTYNLHAGAEAAVEATMDRATEILDCFIDMESTFDPHLALFHLESLVAAARVACGAWEGEQLSPTAEESGAVGGGVGEMGLRAMVVAALAMLGPLLAELPALRGAVFEDAGFAAMWQRLSGGGFVPGWFTPEVRERMRCVVEGREI